MQPAPTARVLIATTRTACGWSSQKGLRQAGYEVTAVRDGDEALRAFSEAPSISCSSTSACRAPTASPCSPSCARWLRRPRDRDDRHGTMETAIQARQRGASTNLAKPSTSTSVLLPRSARWRPGG